MYQATRNKSILDLIFSSVPEIVLNIDILEPLANSDHNMIYCEISLGIMTESKLESSSRNYHKADWLLFYELFYSIDLDSVFMNSVVEDVWRNFTQMIDFLINRCIPFKKTNVSSVPLWETPQVKQARVNRNKAERSYLANKMFHNKRLRHQASSHLKKMVNNAVKQYETMLAENSDIKPFWHYVKSKSKLSVSVGPLTKNTEGELTENAQECAEVLSESFSSVFTREDTSNIPFAIPKTTDELHGFQFTEELISKHLSRTKNFSSPGPDQIPYVVLKAGGSKMLKILCKMFQHFLDSGSVPSEWKVAHITPIFKKGNRRDPLNYRPISLTSCVCKLMESCIREVMWSFWNERDLINPSQFGFTPNSSCTHQLLHYLEDVTTFVDRGLSVDVAYLDFSKAFNSVPHERLLCKLSSLGIKGNLMNWIRDFLTNRKEVVVVAGKKSSSKSMLSGVPQGSCLGPLLFIAYVNDIDDCLEHSVILKYADDIKLYCAFSDSSNSSAVTSFQNDLNSLESWSGKWQLNFNINKCAIVHYGKNNIGHHIYSLAQKTISSSLQEKDLGVYVSHDLKSSHHVSCVVRKAEMVLGILKRSIISRDRKIFLKLYKQLVRPHLEYACVVWNPHFKRDIQLIERVQHRATKCINGLHDKTYSQRLDILKLDSLYKRRSIFDLTEVFKMLHGLSPLQFSNFFRLTGSTRSMRGHAYKLYKKHVNLDCRKYFFTNRIVNVWNSLPEAVVCCQSVAEFKRKVSSLVKDNHIIL